MDKRTNGFRPLVAIGLLGLVALTVPAVHAEGTAAGAATSTASIGLQPAYVSPASWQENATLRAIAFSPDRPSSGGAGDAAMTRIGVAVGDHGVILRGVLDVETRSRADRSSDPAGHANPLGGGAGSSNAAAWRRVPGLDHVQLCDVVWLTDRRVVAVGGGYEPVTGMSRGVVALSDDAGQTWQRGDAHQLTRLRQVRVLRGDAGRSPNGRAIVLEATGDPGEASGIGRYHSYDGGWTWAADVTPAAADPAPSVGPGNLADAWIRAEARGPGGVRFAVGDHGMIAHQVIEPTGRRTWRPIRGGERHTGVLFIAGSMHSIPWALLGREACEVGNRVGVLVDQPAENLWAAEDVRAAEEITRGDARGGERKNARSRRAAVELQKQRDRIEQAATMLGAAFVRFVDSPDSGEHPDGELVERIAAIDPVVIALAAGLPPSREQAWREAAQRHAASAGSSLRRMVMTQVHRHRQPSVGASGELAGAAADATRTGAMSDSSLLGSNALLPQMATLADDLWQDALMLTDPGRRSPLAIGVSPLWESGRDGQGGRDRRGISLTSRLLLPIGCQREAAGEHATSRRRLQITTARMSQSRQLAALLADPQCDAAQVARRLDAMLPTTAAEDRSRLLWSAHVRWLHQPHGFHPPQGGGSTRRARATSSSSSAGTTGVSSPATVQDVLLERMATFADHPAVRRWASLKQASRQNSREWQSRRAIGAATTGNWQSFNASSGERRSSPSAEGAPSPTGNVLSPFQIQPVGYEQSVTPVLVPDVQSIGALPVRRETTRRDQWEYHPVVLAARQITRAGTDPAETNRPGLLSVAPEVLLGESVGRPRLDGRLQDAAWQAARWWEDGGLRLGGVVDGEYLYLAILVPADDPWWTDSAAGPAAGAASDSPSGEPPARLQVAIDRDGDPLTHWSLWVDAEGRQRTTLDHVEVRDGERPTWYAATAPRRIPTSQEWIGQGFLVAAELAIARSGWSAASELQPSWRIHVQRVGPTAEPETPAMPDLSQWRSLRWSP